MSTNQNDFVIDNGTGIAVRQDIEDALQALAGNSSGDSEPSVKYRYQWWADTSAAVMKLRNSSNDGWIEIFQLDGTLTLEDGTVSAPALAARNDLNTGVFFSAADKLNIATGGVERVEFGATTIFNEDGADVDFRIEGDNQANLFYVDAGNDRIAIGHNSPVCALDIRGTGTDFQGIRITNSQHNSGAASSAQLKFAITNSAGERSIRLQCTEMGNDSNDLAMDFYTGGSSSNDSESLAMRINNAGMVMIGTTTEGNESADDFTIAGSSNHGITIRSGTNNNGSLFFSDATSGAAEYAGFVQYQHSTDQLFFGTASTTRMTLTNNGGVGIGTSTLGLGTLTILGSSSAYGGVGNSTTAVGAIVQVQDSAGRAVQMIAPGTGEGGIGTILNHNMTFFVSNTEKARMMSLNLSDPAFLIGTSSNSLSTSSFGIAAFYDGSLVCSRNVTGSNAVVYFGGTNGNANVKGDGDLENTNNSYGAISDETLKQDIVDAGSQWDDIKALKVRKFRFKANPTGALHIGVVAQEVETVSAGLVSESNTDIKTGAGKKVKSVKYSVLYMKAVKCLQEAMAKIEVLETKVAALEAA